MRTLTIIAAASSALLAQTPAELNFLSNHVDGRELTQMLPRYLKAKAYRQIEARNAQVARIASTNDLDARRRYFRERYTKALGGFPSKTPLNPKITGTLDFPDYRIEKVIFESQPGFHVTANLYLPKTRRAPHPAILFPLGHEQGAKAHEAWQYVLVTFAKRGYVCLAWDTIGQGERIQMWDEDFRESKVIRSTTEHSMLGLQTLLVGDALARYTIWDGIRALDYMLTRPEVDARRVGVTGNSGGGTHTAYLAALDDRLAVAAPSCYITSWRKLLDTIGPQDAEQCVPPMLADGLDHGDFALAFAPKPFLVLAAIRDFFSIDGARATSAEVRGVYNRVGADDKFSLFEHDDGHGYTKPRREAAYRWFSKWLEGKQDDRPEPDVKILSEEELWATKSGQVATEFAGEENVYTLNRKRAAQVKQPGATIESVKSMIGWAPAGGPVPVRSYGWIDRGGYRIEKITYEPEPGILAPALLYLPSGTGKRAATILAFGAGKSSAHADAEKLAGQGRVVLAVDLRGLGETRAATERGGSDWPRYFGDYESSMTALLTGKPLVAMRAEDVSRGVDVLAARAEVDAARIEVHGKESAAVPVLYAAAFDRRIAAVTLERMVTSYEAVIRHRIHRQQWENAVLGVLRLYDLPDLIRWIAPRAVHVVQPLNPLGQRHHSSLSP